MNTLLDDLKTFHADHTPKSKSDVDWKTATNAQAKQAIQWLLSVPWKSSLENVWEGIYISQSPFVKILNGAIESGWLEEIDLQMQSQNADQSVKNLMFLPLIENFNIAKNDTQKAKILNMILSHIPKTDPMFLESNAESWFADGVVLNACIAHTANLQKWPYFSGAFDTYFQAYAQRGDSGIGDLLDVVAQNINVIPSPIKDIIFWRLEKWDSSHVSEPFSDDALSIVLQHVNKDTLYDIINGLDQGLSNYENCMQNIFCALPQSMKKQECGHALFSSVPEACGLLNERIIDQMPNVSARGMKKI